MKATVSEKGQVTIPKAVRDRLGVAPGDVLDFSEEDGRLVAVKASMADPIDRVYGMLALGRTTDAFVDDVRGGPASP